LQTQRPVLAQQQQLKLSPRMIQAIRLLALPLQELSEQIRQELEENPALELLTDNAELSLDVMEDSLDTFRDSDETLREAEYSDEAFGFNNDENDRTAIIEQTIATEESLQEHLSGQLGLLPLNDAERQVAERLIQNTDENGFHILPPQEICPDCEPGTLERILSLLPEAGPSRHLHFRLSRKPDCASTNRSQCSAQDNRSAHQSF
jgi:DNA-directed RNA polymerase specialized sigma subunit, sigma54 homolog